MILEPTVKELKWLNVAEYIANQFSTCSRKKYAAIILTNTGRIVGIGYNGSAPNMKHCEDGGCPRASSNVDHGSVYDNCVAIHAEANAIMWSDVGLRSGGTLVINGPPCYGCAKLIASSGISKIVCMYDKNYNQFGDIIEYLNNVGMVVAVKG